MDNRRYTDLIINPTDSTSVLESTHAASIHVCIRGRSAACPCWSGPNLHAKTVVCLPPRQGVAGGVHQLNSNPAGFPVLLIVKSSADDARVGSPAVQHAAGEWVR